LRQDPLTKNIRISISADRGKVTLAGVIDTGDENHRIAELVQSVEGVTAFTSNLIVAQERHSRHREG
jgi:osmotically-inducible protein OsmY